jgi:enamine deaminase RidA (YjgF/YER057c/UK114 family)
MVNDPYARLAALGLTLPTPPAPVASYVPCVLHSGLVFVSGQGPVEPDGHMRIGRVGDDVTVEQARDDARLTALNIVSHLHAFLGDLNRVERIVKVFGMVCAVPDFGHQPEVIEGASALFLEVFGECGRHARSAVGLASLPRGITVEIEIVAGVAGG